MHLKKLVNQIIELLKLTKLVELMHLVMVLPDDGSYDRRSEHCIKGVIENPMIAK